MRSVYNGKDSCFTLGRRDCECLGHVTHLSKDWRFSKFEIQYFWLLDRVESCINQDEVRDHDWRSSFRVAHAWDLVPSLAALFTLKSWWIWNWVWEGWPRPFMRWPWWSIPNKYVRLYWQTYLWDFRVPHGHNSGHLFKPYRILSWWENQRVIIDNRFILSPFLLYINNI